MIIESKKRFMEKLLKIMDRKNHWAWQYFSSDRITRDQLKVHFQQEYTVYIRDFPIFLARIHGKNPPMEVRQDLAANLYEEETGGLTMKKSHPELFLFLMEGLGFKRDEFEEVTLLPASRRYRQWLDRITLNGSWLEAATTITIFVEGSVKDRDEMDLSTPKKEANPEQKILDHPLVRYHNVNPVHLDLVRAHHMIEGSHRIAAWNMVLNYAKTAPQQQKVHRALDHSLEKWLAYRDGIARACKLTP
jgi:pyrroloquinoline quinone (PQQ) biosynthesis protein C